MAGQAHAGNQHGRGFDKWHFFCLGCNQGSRNRISASIHRISEHHIAMPGSCGQGAAERHPADLLGGFCCARWWKSSSCKTRAHCERHQDALPCVLVQMPSRLSREIRWRHHYELLTACRFTHKPIVSLLADVSYTGILQTGVGHEPTATSSREHAVPPGTHRDWGGTSNPSEVLTSCRHGQPAASGLRLGARRFQAGGVLSEQCCAARAPGLAMTRGSDCLGKKISDLKPSGANMHGCRL